MGPTPCQPPAVRLLVGVLLAVGLLLAAGLLAASCLLGAVCAGLRADGYGQAGAATPDPQVVAHVEEFARLALPGRRRALPRQ